MKQLLIIALAFLPLGLIAQQQAPPKGINYQAVAIDNDGNEMVGVDLKSMPVAEKEIRVRFSILKDIETGTLNYREQHLVTTDAYGLFNTVIGQGIEDTSPISFNQIDWGTGYHFLKVEIDIKGGTEYKDMGTQQLWSVPYSLYSKYADTAGNGIESVNDNGDGTLTFTYLDGSTYTTPTLTGLTGPQGDTGPQGPQGDTGNGIVNTLDNGDGTFTLTYDDGTTFTTSDLTGPQGATGAQGIQGIQGVAGANGTNGTNGLDGNGIASTTDNGDGTFTFTYDDGFTFTTSDLTGPQGALGAQGPAGTNGISSTGVRIGFSSSSNWTCPIGITQITVELWGAGGGGGSVSGGAPGGNGGNGGYIKQIISVSPSTVYSVQIGGGGIGTTYFNSFTYQVGNGGNGGQSTFSLPGTVLLQADGGQGGIAGLMTGCQPDQSCVGTPAQSGAIINWPYPANPPSNPSAPYIPVGYVQNPPTGFASGGQGGGYCVNGNQNPPCYSFIISGGQVGEGGFCIISY